MKIKHVLVVQLSSKELTVFRSQVYACPEGGGELYKVDFQVSGKNYGVFGRYGSGIREQAVSDSEKFPNSPCYIITLNEGTEYSVSEVKRYIENNLPTYKIVDHEGRIADLDLTLYEAERRLAHHIDSGADFYLAEQEEEGEFIHEMYGG